MVVVCTTKEINPSYFTFPIAFSLSTRFVFSSHHMHGPGHGYRHWPCPALAGYILARPPIGTGTGMKLRHQLSESALASASASASASSEGQGGIGIGIGIGIGVIRRAGRHWQALASASASASVVSQKTALGGIGMAWQGCWGTGSRWSWRYCLTGGWMDRDGSWETWKNWRWFGKGDGIRMDALPGLPATGRADCFGRCVRLKFFYFLFFFYSNRLGHYMT